MLRRPFESSLRSAVGVVDAAWRRSARFYRDIQRCQRQSCIKTAGERVIDDPARPRIKYRCEIDEPFGNGDVTEIGNPKLIGHGRGDFPHKIRKDRTVVIAIGGSHETAQWPHLQAVVAHDAGHGCL